jgi:hypothetical protein
MIILIGNLVEYYHYKPNPCEGKVPRDMAQYVLLLVFYLSFQFS